MFSTTSQTKKSTTTNIQYIIWREGNKISKKKNAKTTSTPLTPQLPLFLGPTSFSDGSARDASLLHDGRILHHDPSRMMFDLCRWIRCLNIGIWKRCLLLPGRVKVWECVRSNFAWEVVRGVQVTLDEKGQTSTDAVLTPFGGECQMWTCWGVSHTVRQPKKCRGCEWIYTLEI